MITVINDRVAIVPVENPDKIGSLWIPEMAKDRLNQGFVKYKGPDVQNLKIGDYVFFSGYAGTLTYVEGEGKFIIMPEKFCIATLLIDGKRWLIPGLYFKEQENLNDARVEMFEILVKVLPTLDEAQALDLAGKIVRAGGTVRKLSPYFPANYENVMNFMAMAFSENAEFRNMLQVSNLIPGTHDIQKPSEAEYDELGTGSGN